MALLTGSWILDLVLLLSSAVAGVYLYFVYSSRYWKVRKIKYLKPFFPMGNLAKATVRYSIGERLSDLYHSVPNDKYVGIWTAMTPTLLLRDPEIIKQIFVKDFNNFRDRGIYVNDKDDPLSAHLFSMGGPKWKTIRTKMTPTFTSGKMKMMYSTLLECSKELDEFLHKPASKGEVIEVKDIMARFTTDIISSCAFGIQTNSLKNPDAVFRQMGKRIFEANFFRMVKRLFLFFVPNGAKFLKLTTTPPDVTEFFLNAVKETMDYRRETKTSRNDFMQLLIQLVDKGRLDDGKEVKTGQEQEGEGESNDQRFSFLEAAAQAFVFFIAGFETSSTTAQFALYELAKHQDIQDKVREEIRSVLAKHDNQMTYEAVHEMDYLQRVIDETLRKYPPVPSLQRECNKTHQIPGTDLVLEKGIIVSIPILGLQNDPKHFPEPERFDPDRFTEENKATRHQYAYLPFGEGPRNCIGARFGLMQTKVGLVTFLANYRLEISKETTVPMKFETKSFILSPDGGMHLKISKI